jgi:hypothetical protein
MSFATVNVPWLNPSETNYLPNYMITEQWLDSGDTGFSHCGENQEWLVFGRPTRPTWKALK